jgi:hypothetical protein
MTVRPRVLRHKLNRTGHPFVCLSAQGKAPLHVGVHRLMAWAFIGPQLGGMVVAHYDDNPKNNVLSNLRYTDHHGNVSDAVRNGRMRRGESAPTSKLNNAAVRDIRASTAPLAVSAKKHGVSKSLIGQVRRRVIWRHVA